MHTATKERDLHAVYHVLFAIVAVCIIRNVDAYSNKRKATEPADHTYITNADAKYKYNMQKYKYIRICIYV